MGARTYRTFKQLLRASKTRKAGKGKTQTKKTRRVKRRPFFSGAGSGAGAPQKKQKGGGITDLLSGESTVVAPLDDEESPRVVRSAASYTASLPS